MDAYARGLLYSAPLRVSHPYLGNITIRSDIYRIVSVSISGNNFGYTLCSDCLWKTKTRERWRTYRQTIWPKERRICEACGALTPQAVERRTLEIARKGRKGHLPHE